MIRAKFTCQQSTFNRETQTATVILTPATSPIDENLTHRKATPSGEITLQITELGAAFEFRANKDYYVDFTAVRSLLTNEE
ncbi:hypothetical protein [Nostoc sp.]|uniref:hypothetical protein n=1 Tax=Nostoc sp. TaxID=1180 RepID=UPI002FF77422